MNVRETLADYAKEIGLWDIGHPIIRNSSPGYFVEESDDPTAALRAALLAAILAAIEASP